MIQDILLTSPEFVKSVTPISSNTNEKTIQFAIRETQDCKLAEIVGTKMLNKLKKLVSTGDIEKEQYLSYKQLLNASQYFIAYSVVTELAIPLSFKFDNAGVITTSDEHVDNVNLKDVFTIKDYYTKKVDFYRSTLQTFILNHIGQLPEITGTQCNAIHSELKSSATSAFFLGGARGKGRYTAKLRDKYGNYSGSADDEEVVVTKVVWFNVDYNNTTTTRDHYELIGPILAYYSDRTFAVVDWNDEDLKFEIETNNPEAGTAVVEDGVVKLDVKGKDNFSVKAKATYKGLEVVDSKDETAFAYIEYINAGSEEIRCYADIDVIGGEYSAFIKDVLPFHFKIKGIYLYSDTFFEQFEISALNISNKVEYVDYDTQQPKDEQLYEVYVNGSVYQYEAEYIINANENMPIEQDPRLYRVTLSSTFNNIKVNEAIYRRFYLEHWCDFYLYPRTMERYYFVDDDTYDEVDLHIYAMYAENFQHKTFKSHDMYWGNIDQRKELVTIYPRYMAPKSYGTIEIEDFQVDTNNQNYRLWKGFNDNPHFVSYGHMPYQRLGMSIPKIAWFDGNKNPGDYPTMEWLTIDIFMNFKLKGVLGFDQEIYYEGLNRVGGKHKPILVVKPRTGPYLYNNGIDKIRFQISGNNYQEGGEYISVEMDMTTQDNSIDNPPMIDLDMYCIGPRTKWYFDIESLGEILIHDREGDGWTAVPKAEINFETPYLFRPKNGENNNIWMNIPVHLDPPSVYGKETHRYITIVPSDIIKWWKDDNHYGWDYWWNEYNRTPYQDIKYSTDRNLFTGGYVYLPLTWRNKDTGYHKIILRIPWSLNLYDNMKLVEDGTEYLMQQDTSKVITCHLTAFVNSGPDLIRTRRNYPGDYPIYGTLPPEGVESYMWSYLSYEISDSRIHFDNFTEKGIGIIRCDTSDEDYTGYIDIYYDYPGPTFKFEDDDETYQYINKQYIGRINVNAIVTEAKPEPTFQIGDILWSDGTISQPDLWKDNITPWNKYDLKDDTPEDVTVDWFRHGNPEHPNPLVYPVAVCVLPEGKFKKNFDLNDTSDNHLGVNGPCHHDGARFMAIGALTENDNDEAADYPIWNHYVGDTGQTGSQREHPVKAASFEIADFNGYFDTNKNGRGVLHGYYTECAGTPDEPYHFAKHPIYEGKTHYVELLDKNYNVVPYNGEIREAEDVIFTWKYLFGRTYGRPMNELMATTGSIHCDVAVNKWVPINDTENPVYKNLKWYVPTVAEVCIAQQTMHNWGLSMEKVNNNVLSNKAKILYFRDRQLDSFRGYKLTCTTVKDGDTPRTLEVRYNEEICAYWETDYYRKFNCHPFLSILPEDLDRLGLRIER